VTEQIRKLHKYTQTFPLSLASPHQYQYGLSANIQTSRERERENIAPKTLNLISFIQNPTHPSSSLSPPSSKGFKINYLVSFLFVSILECRTPHPQTTPHHLFITSTIEIAILFKLDEHSLELALGAIEATKAIALAHGVVAQAAS